MFSIGGLSPTLTAQMGKHGNNFVYVLEESDGLQEIVRHTENRNGG